MKTSKRLYQSFLTIAGTALLMTALSVCFAVRTAAATYILGDADTDGVVTVLDATAIQRKLASIPTAFSKEAADADRDGVTAIIDATYIQRWLAKIQAPEGIGEVFTYDPHPGYDFDSPEITSLQNTTDGVAVTWTPVEGAQYYAVLSKTETGSWTKKGVTDGASFSDTSVYSGSTYTYKVRCTDADGGKYLSPNTDTGPSILFLRTPRLNSAASVSGGVRISFATVAGAMSYEILRKNADGGYETLDETDGSPYIDTTAVSGTEYTYSVRAKGDNDAQSAYDEEGVSITYLSAPVMKSAENTAQGVKVEWEPVTGAKHYCILKKSGDDALWAIRDVVDETTFVDDSLYSGGTYYYSVRCVDDDLTTYVSGKDENGLRIVFLRQPELRTLHNVNNGVRLTFGFVSEADEYEIYRKSDGDFSLIDTTDQTFYHDTTVELGVTYTYTVRAVKHMTEEVAYSSYDKNGLNIAVQDISYTAYVVKPFINLYTDYTDDVPAVTIPYMTELKYLETSKTFENGSWLKVKYQNENYYLWEPSGEEYIVDEQSTFEYASDNEIVQRILDKSMDMYTWPIVYRRGDSTGIIDENGQYGFDCSGFICFVLESAMREYVPTYKLYAKVDALYQTEVIYNKGIHGEFSANDIAIDSLMPGDILFFNLEDEAEVDEVSDDIPATHCGIYLGNNEFIHCTHYNWGPTGVFIMPLTDSYLETLTLIRRFTPEIPIPANKTMYSTSFRTNVRDGMSADAGIIDTLAAETQVNVLYTSTDLSTGEPMWAYIGYGENKTGFVSLDYLSETTTNMGETRYVATTGIKLYEQADTSSDYIEVYTGTEVVFNGVYGNSHFYKISYGSENRFMYCSDEVGIDTVLTDNYDTLMEGIGSRTVTSGTYLRSNMDASNTDSVIQTVKKDTVVTLIAVSSSGAWSYVRTPDGICGFITSSRLQ